MRLTNVLEQLEQVDYPATTDEVLDTLDDRRLDLPNGSERLPAVFDRVDVDAFTCPDDACLSLLSGLGPEAVGRRWYSDRDPPTIGGDESRRISF